MKFKVEGGTKKSTVDKNLPTKDIPKYKKKEKFKGIEGKGTINLGNINITLGGVYDSGQAKESYPSNIYNIPDRKSQQIYRTSVLISFELVEIFCSPLQVLL